MSEGSILIRTVNVFPFRGSGMDTEFLVIKKADDPELSQAGMWQVVSGGREKGETLWQAALRELREETGCVPVRFYEIGAESYYSYSRDSICLNPSFAAQLAPQSEVRLSAEHVAFEWLGFDQAILRLPFPGQGESVTRIRFSIADPVGPVPMEIPPEVWRSG